MKAMKVFEDPDAAAQFLAEKNVKPWKCPHCGGQYYLALRQVAPGDLVDVECECGVTTVITA